MRRAIGPTLAAFLVLALVALPGPSSGSPADPSTLVVGQNTGILITLDPAVVFEVEGVVIVDQLYDKLVDLDMVDGKIKVVPEVAESWTLAPDGKTWTFKIRQGMKFPSGRAVDANAVVYSLRRALRLNRPSIYMFNELGLTKDNAETAVRMLDPYTVQIVVGQSFAPDLVLAILSFVATAVVDPGVVEQHIREGELGSDWLKDHSAGSGPYQLMRWERNEVVDMVAYAGYWRGIPPVKRIVIRDIPEPSAQRIALEKADIDVAWNLSPQMRQEIRTAKTPGLAIVRVPGHGMEYIGMNVKYPPLAKEQVREAIRYAIDYKAILEGIMRGEAIPLQTFVPVGYLGHNPAMPFKQDLNKAKQLLAEGGYPNGFEVELATNAPHPTRPDVAQVIQNELAKVGIKVKITTSAAATVLGKYREQGLQMILYGWGVDYPDPDALAKPFADGTIRQLAWRNAWMDPKATDLTRKAMLERDPRRRVALYKELTELVAHKGPFAILYQITNNWVIRTYVKGFEQAAALGTFHFDYTKISKVRQ
ncbi:MAG: ABC transporter substrate-binding protein [Armatimonadota bacterium]|nr:ABC transporter substrate-binding protein [Armatimonadota bacterium]MDR7450914.1 ABC transporter substrate-binding protein [Armatimonadota bacterium]MDR7465836.1 ABC transporter substrate-binding protein [Armatimonadota bacterium]MDR7493744.1 ABC transporter substrate-binding protein [Armatimonadota bacterium]MDR7498350.1 ABC transporter substrate-binding protein [Armatimonadota bacterium]